MVLDEARQAAGTDVPRLVYPQRVVRGEGEGFGRERWQAEVRGVGETRADVASGYEMSEFPEQPDYDSDDSDDYKSRQWLVAIFYALKAIHDELVELRAARVTEDSQ